MATLWDIKTKTWQEMVVNSDSTTYNTDRLWNMINEVGEEIIQKRVFNELSNSYVLWSDLPFYNDKFPITIINDLVLTASVAIADIAISLDTTDLPDTWAVQILWDIIEYTGKTATEITWVTGILVAHAEWDTVIPLYNLASDFYKPIKMYKIVREEQVEILQKDVPNVQLRSYYDIVQKWDNWYIKSKNLDLWIYYIDYMKKYEAMTSDLDDSIFPDDIALNVIPFIVGWRLIKDQDLRVQLLSEWYGKLAWTYTKYGSKTSKQKKITYTRFWFSSLKGY